MGKIIDIKTATTITADLKNARKTIVLVGGCFDIIHKGHIIFLRKAKKLGGILFVLLESDKNIKKLKGKNRPINTMADRALIMASFIFTDYVITLPELNTNEEYDEMIYSLKPDIIATTKSDPGRSHKKRQAEKLGIKLVDVLDRIKNQSTSRIAKLLRNEL